MLFPYNSRFFFNGGIAQLVEQRTENPRVPGSIPGPATTLKSLGLRVLNKIQQAQPCALFRATRNFLAILGVPARQSGSVVP